MQSIYLHIRRLGSARRLLATLCFVVLFASIASHALAEIGSNASDSNFEWCDVTRHIPHTADCPHNHKPGTLERDLYSEVAHHWVAIADLKVPAPEILGRGDDFLLADADPILRPHTPPFQPPKHA